MPIRVRFAPSPTGDLHLGAIRAAVNNFLFALHEGGTFILRIEDTDQAREKEGSTEGIVESLEWLGITPDEGVYLDEEGNLAERGEFGPYTQSKRLAIYEEHVNVLLESGAAYRCFCTPERLQAMRESQEKQHLPPRYDRTCRNLSPEESAKRAASERFVVRQAIPDAEQVVLEDIVRGAITFESKDLDDHVLMKSDGFPTYHLASVVDDHLMEISHVLRGEEWLPSAPRHILLYQAFGWQAPRFAHLPVILGPDGKRKLSKREGAMPVLEYARKGYLPEAVLNFLAFLGWSPGTEEEIFTADELGRRFELARVQKSPAVFDDNRLDYLDGVYIRQLQLGEVVELMLPWLIDANLVVKSETNRFSLAEPLHINQSIIVDYLLAVAYVAQQRLRHFDQTVEFTSYFFKRPVVDESLRTLIVPKKGKSGRTLSILAESITVLEAVDATTWTQDAIQEALGLFIAKKEYSNMEVLWPIRAALTGAGASPGAYEMLAILGKDESLERLRALAT
jgi:nondiscriminating glutamyl-tRNA synthetase